MTQSGGCFCSGHALHVDIHEHHIKATRFKVFQEVFAAGKAMDLKPHCQLRTQAVQSMLHVGGFLRHIRKAFFTPFADVYDRKLTFTTV